MARPTSIAAVRKIIPRLQRFLEAYLKRAHERHTRARVHERDHHTAFAHAGGGALHGVGTNVTYGKDPWNRGFEQVGITFDRPALSSSTRSGDHVAPRIPFDRCWQPCRLRIRSDHYE